ncbi:MAG: response regulator [Phycisphaerales bacterium]|nr:response regulator [Phycisphaerae bacterium]NNF43428.1 response regulator [Phycisphaerales bacterium]NNM24950.1 response regulator [Phycisphaerales bacterium]
MCDRILVVDDDASIARALSIRLEAAGYDVTHAADGAAGLDVARTQPPALILLDIRMPGLDGFDVNRALKEDPALADIPVVFLSANVRDSTRQKALAAGAAAFLAKPYDAAMVLKTIARLLTSTTA